MQAYRAARGLASAVRCGSISVTVGTSTFSGELAGKPLSNTINMTVAPELRSRQWQLAVGHSQVSKPSRRHWQ